MTVLNGRASAVGLCAVFTVMVTGTYGANPTPSEGENTSGLKKLELSSYYDPQPISVSPAAPSYTLPIRLGDIANADLVCWVLELDDNAKEAIERNGFVVVKSRDPANSPLPYDEMVEPYVYLKEEGVPNFVTSDSLVHLYHVQFDEILRCVEENEFFPKLVVMSDALLRESLRQYESFPGDLKEVAKRNVAYFAVAMKLLGAEVNVPDAVSGQVNGELEKIEAHSGFTESDIFIYNEDYSQYVPRGHYTRSETLRKYFKAMMWYGRMAFLLKGDIPWGPCPGVTKGCENSNDSGFADCPRSR